MLKQTNILAVSVFLIFVFAACSPKPTTLTSASEITIVACKPLPDLPVPEDLPKDLRKELSWMNTIHRHLEEDTYTSVKADTLKRLEELMDRLNQEPENTEMAVFRARANRLVAFDRQNHDLYSESYEILRPSLTNLEQFGDTSAIAQYERSYHYNLIGAYAVREFQIDAAIAHNKKSLDINSQQGLVLEVMKDYGNLAISYGIIQRYDLQEQALEQAMDVAEQFDNCIRSGNDLNAVAGMYFHLAKDYLYRGLEKMRQGDTLYAESVLEKIEINLANAEDKLVAAGMEDNAQMQLQILSLRIALAWDFPFAGVSKDSMNFLSQHVQEVVPPGSPMSNYFQLAHFLYRSRYADDCSGLTSAAYRNTVDLVDGLTLADIPAQYHHTFIGLQRKLHVFEANCASRSTNAAMPAIAKQHALRSMRDFEAYVASLKLESTIENVGGNWQGFYAQAIKSVQQACLADGKTAPAYFSEDVLSLSDRSKSIGLRLALEKRRNFHTYGVGYRKLYNELEQLRADLRQAEAKGMDVVPHQNAILAFFSRQRESTVSYRTQFFNDLRYFDQFTLSDVRDKLLSPSRAGLDMFYGDGHLIVSVVTFDDERQFFLPVSQELADAINNSKGRSAAGSNSAQYAHTIYRLALKPAIDWLRHRPEINELIVVRDKWLADFAFGYLPTQPVTGSGWADSPLLIDDYAISYAHSFSTLLATKDIYDYRPAAFRQHGTFLATTGMKIENRNIPPLPRFEKQVKTCINAYLPDSDLIETATSANFLASVTDYRYLLLAGHGYKDELLQEQHYLQFHPTATDTHGRVTTADLYAKNLASELTVLLNCESARGTNFNYEGRKSLARSFLYAGSSAVIAGNDLLSEDTYPEITAEFYRLWIEKGQPAQIALRNAKQSFRRANPGLAPYRWGDLIYYGLPDIEYEGRRGTLSR